MPKAQFANGWESLGESVTGKNRATQWLITNVRMIDDGRKKGAVSLCSKVAWMIDRYYRFRISASAGISVSDRLEET